MESIKTNFKFPTWYIDADYKWVDTQADLAVWIDILRSQPTLSIDIETSGLNHFQDRILAVQIGWAVGRAIYIDIESLGNGYFRALKSLLEAAPLIIGYNLKFDMSFLRRVGIELQNIEDVQCMVWLKDANKHMLSLKEVAKDELGLDTVELSSFFEKKKEINYQSLDRETKRLYGCGDVDLTFRLWEKFKHVKEENPFIFPLEMKVLKVLQDMTERGILVSTEECQRQSKTIDTALGEYEKEINGLLAGRNVPPVKNLDSPIQVEKALQAYGIDWTGWDKTEGGKFHKEEKKHYKMDKDSFKLQEEKEPICKALARWKILKRIQAQFLDKLPGMSNPITGRVHTELISTNVVSGRLCSRSPNLQNIPKTLEEWQKPIFDVRKCFVAQPGYSFIDCDYSQVELRVAASMSGEPLWWEAFTKGEDLHSKMAMRMFNIPEGQKPSDHQRQLAKNGNFGLLTGQTPMTFSKMYNVKEDLAKEIYRTWWATVGQVDKWRRRAIAKARKYDHCWVSTFFGRKRWIPELEFEKDWQRKQGERSVVSHMVQGGAADIMKIALWKLDEAIKKSKLDIKMLLSVHDQILFEVKDEDLEAAKSLIKGVMEFHFKGWVPLKISMKIGKSWGDCK